MNKISKRGLGALALAGLLALGAGLKAHEHDMKNMKDGKAMADHDDDDAKADAGKTVSVVGEVLDMDCYMNEGASGKEHASCAVMCLKNGGPVGLLGDDGKAYFLTANEGKGMMKYYEQVRELGAKKVKVTGVLQTRGGATSLRVDGVEKL